ncbi:MAG TPA: DUF6569 family protein, partial [Propionibacteriaceae bacterium]
RGTSRGALTVFPIWGGYSGPRGYSLNGEACLVTEREDGSDVSSLTASNQGSRPLLILEGQLMEGGWQHRMLTRSVLLPAGASMDFDVVCVEAGRWAGGAEHRSSDRRGSLRVRGALTSDGDQQGEVWSRVTGYQARYGANDTSSLVGHVDRADAEVDRLVEGFAPLLGQVGVVIGIAGQPVVAEVFDSATTLTSQFRSLVRAAALDALGQQEVATPSRRARRFMDRASRVPRTAIAAAGLGRTLAGADPYATVSALAWRRRDVHVVATNPRHSLNLVNTQ